MNFIKEWSGTVALIAIVLVLGFSSSPSFGASGTRFPNGVSADTTSPITGEVRGTTLTITGASTLTGALTLSSTLSAISGVTSLATTSVESFTQGGDHCTLTDANGGAYTLTQAEMSHCSVFKFAAGGAGQEVIQLTTPATSTLTTLLPNAGDRRMWIYDASALAAATTTTWTAGTGINQIAVDANSDLIDGLEYSRLDCWREADTDVSCIVDELVVSD